MNRRHFLSVSAWGALATLADTRAAPRPATSAVKVSELQLLPFPQEVAAQGDSCSIARPVFELSGPETPMLREAAQSLRQYSGHASGHMTVRLGSREKGYADGWISKADQAWITGCEHPQASLVTITHEAITVIGVDEIGLLYGVQTVNQLLIQAAHNHSQELPGLSIRDWPDLRWRCLAPQLTWYAGWAHWEGFDIGNWGLDEWKWLGDFSLLHKANAWAVCMYGAWPFAFPAFPETTAQFDSFGYDPQSGVRSPRRYVHPNIRNEFFPEVIRYANARGIKVHAYIGLNTYNGTYVLKHEKASAASPVAEALPFAAGLESYWRAFIRRILELGFNGFVFEEPEAYHVPNQSEECYRAFWAPWAEKYGFSSVKETDRHKPPIGVHVEYYCWLFREFDRLIREEAAALGLEPEIFLITHILLHRIMQETKTEEERLFWVRLIDEKRGRKVPCILFEDNEKEYARLLGGGRIATLGGRGGAGAGFYRTASINNDRTHGDIGEDLAEERDKQQRMVAAGGFGSMAYCFEWTHAEVFAYLGCQYQWRHTGVPAINNTDAFGFLEYAYCQYYGAEAGALAAKAYTVNSCVNEWMAPLGQKSYFMGNSLGPEAQLLAALADKADELALAAYHRYTGAEPDLDKAAYLSQQFRWTGFDPDADQLFKRERLRLLAVSTRRSKLLAEVALCWRRANSLLARGGALPEIWRNLKDAAAAAKQSELLYYRNYDEHESYGGKGREVSRKLQDLASLVLQRSGLSEESLPFFSGPFPDQLRPLAQAPTFCAWEKLTDMLPDHPPAGEQLVLRTSIGLGQTIDFFCLGGVFAVQLWRNNTWETLFRRALLKKDAGWEKWEIPLPVGPQTGRLGLRLCTAAYTRAHEPSWPEWHWGFWGRPEIVLGREKKVRVIDLIQESAHASRSVLLDQDGALRPFDAPLEDSTGATLTPVEEREAEKANAPLPAQRCIAAFVPHKSGASGVTIAEFQIVLAP